MALATPIGFLMEGDPVIRWQAMRDLLDAPPAEWETERNRVGTEGWGARFLGAQNEDGSWPTGRWTGSVWTLVTLCEIGLPAPDPRLERGFEFLLARGMPTGGGYTAKSLAAEVDLCHLAFWLRVGSRFASGDERLPQLADLVLSWQMADGGWNCRRRRVPKTRHSSFHTTFNVLEALRDAADAGLLPRDLFEESEARAIEFMLEHRLYRSDKTGEIVDERFLELTHPSYWHYTVLRGLDYIQRTPFIRDPRLIDALDYLEGRRKPNGRWPSEKRIPCTTLFDMEKPGQESRWNTLRALRVLRRSGRITD
jgi:hypothetical protein